MLRLHNGITSPVFCFFCIWFFLTACKTNHSPKDQKTSYQNTIKRIVCSYGPIEPLHVSLSHSGTFTCAGTVFGDKPSQDGKFNTYYTGKLSDSLFTVFEKLVLDYKVKYDQKQQEVIIGASWYCLHIHYQNGQDENFEGIYNDTEQKTLHKLMHLYKLVRLNKRKGNGHFETLPCTYPPLPQPQLLPIKPTPSK